MPTEAIVVGAGRAYRLRADALAREFERGGALPDLLLGYTRDLITQAGRAAIVRMLRGPQARVPAARTIRAFIRHIFDGASQALVQIDSRAP